MTTVIKKQLSDAVSLTVIPTDKFKMSYLAVYFTRLANENEAPMNAILPEILTRSCQKYPSLSLLNAKLETLYGASLEPVNTLMGDNHVFGVYSSFPDNKYAFDGTDILSEIIALISEVLKRPLLDRDNGFDRSVFESEKEKLCGRIMARINNPVSYAVRRCEEIMCEGEPFSISHNGTIESVSQLESKSVYDYYKKLPEGTAVSVYYSGSVDADLISDKISPIFDDFKSKTENFTPKEVIRKASGDIKTFVEEQKLSQGKLTIGFRTGFCLSDKDYHAFTLMNCILGGSATSKLFMNVREKMSLCYYCSSRPNSLKGITIISSGIEVENFEKAKNAILLQIESMKNGDISDFEIESAKNTLVNSYKELTDSPSDIALWYFNRSFVGRTDTPEENIELVRALTKDDIISAASRLSLDTVYFLKGTLSNDEEYEDEADF